MGCLWLQSCPKKAEDLLTYKSGARLFLKSPDIPYSGGAYSVAEGNPEGFPAHKLFDIS
jgi:hypothetical protein